MVEAQALLAVGETVSVSERLMEMAAYLPVGLLLAIAIIEIFGGGRKSLDLDKAVVVLLVVASVLFLVGAFVAYSQASVLGQQAATKAAGIGVIVGIVCAVAAMLKQQCYLQKLLLMAKAKSPHARRSAKPNHALPALYAIVFLAVFVGGVGGSLIQPGAPSASDLADAEDETSDVEEPVEPDVSTPEIAVAVPPEPAPPIVPDPMGDEPEPEVEIPAEAIELAEGDDEMMPDEPEPEVAVVTPAPEEASVPVTVKPAAPRLNPAAVNAFKRHVAPVIKARCVSCHGSQKQKGGLRLDTPDWIRKGGNSGPVVTPFDPDRSYLYTSTVLPEDDPDIMPAKGKPLSSRETNYIKRWIEAGAPMGDGKDKAAALAASAGNEMAAPVEGAEIPPAVAQAMANAHIQYKPIDGGMLEIDCSLTRNYDDVTLDLSILEPIASKIHTLDLSKTRVRDSDLVHVSKMTNLVRLLLSRTKVGDEGMSHLSGLGELEILNLYGTDVSDDGLQPLAALGNLKKIYLWNSRATSAGGNKLAQAIKGLEVNIGD